VILRRLAAGALAWAAVAAGGASSAPAIAAGPPSTTPALSAAAGARTIRVTSNDDSGEGSLRAAIEQANAATRPSFPGESLQRRAARGAIIEVVFAADRVLLVARALPDLEGPGIVLDGGGATIRQAKDCVRERGRMGCDGIVVAGPGITVRNLRIAGFVFDGVAVRGRDARDVRIQDVHAIDNLDDGIGVSAGAGPVLIEHCLLMGNGYRTKGKGVLVFDDATATIRDSVAVANRDGVSVTRRSRAELEDVWIVGSFDKGLGVSGGAVRGRGNRLIANGDGVGFEQKPPNADGLRVGLAGTAELSSTRIEGNGDSGVVALDSSSVVLRDATIGANRGRGIVCGSDAEVSVDGASVRAGARKIRAAAGVKPAARGR